MQLSIQMKKLMGFYFERCHVISLTGVFYYTNKGRSRVKFYLHFVNVMLTHENVSHLYFKFKQSK